MALLSPALNFVVELIGNFLSWWVAVPSGRSGGTVLSLGFWRGIGKRRSGNRYAVGELAGHVEPHQPVMTDGLLTKFAPGHDSPLRASAMSGATCFRHACSVQGRSPHEQ